VTNYCIPFNPKPRRHKKCSQCGEKTKTVKLWVLCDVNINSYIKICICDECMLEIYKDSDLLEQVKRYLTGDVPIYV
jgi:hypothetical protein